MSLSKPVKITILSQQYQVSCLPEQEQSLVDAARLLDDRLKHVREQKRLALDQAAIMTALNLAHELLDISAKYEVLQQQVALNLKELNKSIDSLL